MLIQPRRVLTRRVCAATLPSVSTAKGAFRSVTVVIPAYNASDVVSDTLTAVRDYLQRADLPHEIIVVDDGSTDQTASLVREHPGDIKLLSNGRNRGKGFTVRHGMLEGKCDWVLFMDVDNSTTIDHLDRFAPHAADADVLIASRRLPDSNIVRAQPKFRQMLGKTFPYFARVIALPGIRDTQCGFKVFRREAAADAFSLQESEGFCFDVEVLLIAKRLGYRIREVAIDWDNPPSSTVRVSLDPIKMLIDLFRIAWRHRPSRYPAIEREANPPSRT